MAELTSHAKLFFQDFSLPLKAALGAALPDVFTPMSAKLSIQELKKAHNLPLYQQENLQSVALEQAIRLIETRKIDPGNFC
jgi:hypothetical protein